jgi:hypothetical protein
MPSNNIVFYHQTILYFVIKQYCVLPSSFADMFIHTTKLDFSPKPSENTINTIFTRNKCSGISLLTGNKIECQFIKEDLFLPDFVTL